MICFHKPIPIVQRPSTDQCRSSSRGKAELSDLVVHVSAHERGAFVYSKNSLRKLNASKESSNRPAPGK